MSWVSFVLGIAAGVIFTAISVAFGLTIAPAMKDRGDRDEKS